MHQIIALKQHIEGLGMFNPERIDVAIEQGTLEFSGAESGPDLLLYRHRYSGSIELMGAAGDLRDLLGHLAVWLEANGAGETPPRATLDDYDGEPVDKGRSDITLRLTFEEEIHYTPAEPAYTGKDKLTWNGADWKRGVAAEDVADTLQEPIVASVAP
jgi:hypothetical protein